MVLLFLNHALRNYSILYSSLPQYPSIALPPHHPRHLRKEQETQLETDHRAKIRDLYRHMELPTIEVLHIPDEYEFMDSELVDILTDKVNGALERHWGL